VRSISGVALKVADASVKDFNGVQVCAVFGGAVLGRRSAKGRATRSANEGLMGGIGSEQC